MTAWDDLWREGVTPWDKGEAAPPLAEYLAIPGNVLAAAERVLVPGCGSGHDVREIAGRTGAAVTGLDLSPTAIAKARGFPGAGREIFECGDFFEWRDGGFDVLWEHTCFCAIQPDDRRRYAAAAARLVKVGGFLVGVFYLQPWGEDEIPEPPPFGAGREEIVECLGGAFELIWDKVPDRAYPGREGREWLAVFRRSHAKREVAGPVSPS